ncbi:MAG: hypothetical protein ACI87E_000581 [Mariniblastus sp.]|jgi:hypothetical protein
MIRDDKRRIIKWVLQLTGVAFLIFATVGCGTSAINPEIDSLQKSLSETQRKLEKAFVASTEEEYRSLNDMKVERFSLVWSFKPVNELRKFVYVHPTIEEWEASVLESTEKDMKKSDAFDLFQDGSMVIFNPTYSAKLTESPRNLVSLQEEKLWKSLSEYNLEALFLMHPNNWSVRKFLETNGVGNIEVLPDKEDSDLEIYKCRVNLTQEQSPFGDSFDGSWIAKYSRSKKMMVEQSYQCQKYTMNIAYQFEDEKSILPKSSVSTYTDKNSKQVLRKTKRFNRIVLNHDLSETACYLSYYGLPEPESMHSRSMWNLRSFALALAGVAGLAFVGFVVRNRNRI